MFGQQSVSKIGLLTLALFFCHKKGDIVTILLFMIYVVIREFMSISEGTCIEFSP